MNISNIYIHIYTYITHIHILHYSLFYNLQLIVVHNNECTIWNHAFASIKVGTCDPWKYHMTNVWAPSLTVQVVKGIIDDYLETYGNTLHGVEKESNVSSPNIYQQKKPLSKFKP